MIVEQAPVADAILQSARHVLWVEGSREDALDPVVLRRLVDFIDVRPLGASSGIRLVAEAMRREHPTYYFVIDRDHHQTKTVEESWDRFLDPDTSNVLIWRQREIENYFLDPSYSGKSQFLICSQADLADAVRAACQSRLYFEAGACDSAAAAAARSTLIDAAKPHILGADVAARFSADRLIAQYDELLQRMTGGRDPIERDVAGRCAGQGRAAIHRESVLSRSELLRPQGDGRDREGVAPRIEAGQAA